MKVIWSKFKLNGFMNGEIISNVLNMNTLESFKQVKSIILDVDGVLTNSQLLITEKGELLRSMNAKEWKSLANTSAPTKILGTTVLTNNASFLSPTCALMSWTRSSGQM